MPRELVENRWSETFHRSHAMCPSGPDGPCLPNCPGIEVPADRKYVSVGWGSHGDVQIGMVDPEDVITDPGGKSASEHQMWLDLDRDGINALIRLLRKARDRAFGRDE